MRSDFLFYMILCGLVAVFAPDRGRADGTDLPALARMVLAKAGKLMNDKDYGKAIALLVDFQA